MIQQYARVYIMIGFSVLSLTALAPVNAATPMGEQRLNPGKENTSVLRQGLPGRRLGGGTRTGSVFTEVGTNLAALTTPASLTITTAPQPTLLFYIPEMQAAHDVEFVLRDPNDRLVYQTTFQVDTTGGIVRVELAEASDLPALNIDETYFWYFSILPDDNDRANDIVVYGALQRVEPADWLEQQHLDMALLDQLTTAPPLKKARILYQQANLWHDALLLLDQQRQTNPDNAEVAAEWTQLLDALGLAMIAQTSSPLSESLL